MSNKIYERSFRAFRLLLWVGLICFGVAILAIQVQARLREAKENLASLEQEAEVRYPVSVTPVRPSSWESWKSYYGQAKAARTQDVTSYVREVVRNVHVQVGDQVKEGQPVVTLLKEDYTAKAQATSTSHKEALLNYNRLLELSKQGGVAQSEVDRAYAILKAEAANAQSSKSTLQRTDLRSSIAGVVATRNVEPGEVADVGKTLITIVDLSEMEARLMVSKKDIHNITKDTKVKIVLDDRELDGWVKRLSPEAESGSGLYPVLVGISSESNVFPGTYLEGRFLVEHRDDVIVIPSDVVIYRGDQEFVYVLGPDENASVLRAITTDEGRNGQVIVTSGLSVGDLLITSGNRPLFDGAPISLDIVANAR
jgi:membrane fusion protein (multidrug efflux system)